MEACAAHLYRCWCVFSNFRSIWQFFIKKFYSGLLYIDFQIKCQMAIEKCKWRWNWVVL